MGTLKRGKGHDGSESDVVQDDYRLATAADIVADPSAPNAFVQGIMEGKEWIYVDGRFMEQDIEETRKIIDNGAKTRNLEEAQLKAWSNFFLKL